MKVFLGWSGDTSHKVALALHNWLPRVIQTVIPYVSSEDIAKGARWIPDIAKELQASRYGIISVTRDNVNSPWINFEAGSLSKEIDQAYVSPFLFNLKPTEINGPLSQFQHTVNEKDDLKKLIFTINDKKEHVLQKDALEEAFEMWWPKLETKLAEIEKEESNRPAPQKRKPEEMLEELLELTRASRLDGRERSAYQEHLLKLSHDENKEALARLLATLGTLARNVELQLQRDIAAKKLADAISKAKQSGYELLTGEPLSESGLDRLSALANIGRDSVMSPPPPPPKSEPEK
jgi:hypothetical protein